MRYTYQELNEFTQEEINKEFHSAAYKNDFEYIKILLTSSDLKLHAQINADSRPLAFICSNGDLNTLRYVLTSSELKEHANIHLDHDRALGCAIYAGDIPMVKYLLTSPELKGHSDIYCKHNEDYINIEYIFKMSEFAKSEKLINYFTLDYAVEKKDLKIYEELFKHADDDDFKTQITNNLFSNILKEKDPKHKYDLTILLLEIDVTKYKELNSYYVHKESYSNELKNIKNEELNLLSQNDLNNLLVQAVFKNDLSTIKYLLSSPHLEKHAQINHNRNILACICANGDLETLKYVLTSPDLKEHANIQIKDGKALTTAMKAGNIPLVKYLLTSPELKKHSNIYPYIDTIFKVEFDMSLKLIDYFTSDYACEKKDSNIFKALIQCIDDKTLEDHITNNLYSIILKEKDEDYKLKLKSSLKSIDTTKYKMLIAYELNEELSKELQNNENKKSNKIKI
jgi:hypothetical protein